MKNFLKTMEEKFVFPIGRKTWQFLALFALFGIATFIIWYVINLLPAKRENVIVTRNEVINNQVDTNEIIKSIRTSNGCDFKEYKITEDSLKRDLPKSEWINLGDSSVPYSDYKRDEYGNFITDENGDYIVVLMRSYNSNPLAIPNIIDNLFNSLSIDTTQICERVEILKLIHKLNTLTEPEYLGKEAFFAYVNLIRDARYMNLDLLEKSVTLSSKIQNKKLYIQNRDDLYDLFKYLEYVKHKSITDDQINLCLTLLDEHRKLKSPKYNKIKYFELSSLIFESQLSADDIKEAVNYFIKDLEYYDKNDLYKSLNRFLNLYEEKITNAELKKTKSELEKYSNRTFSLLAIGICFVSIISIATILLLYSIQQLLKEHTSTKKM